MDNPATEKKKSGAVELPSAVSQRLVTAVMAARDPKELQASLASLGATGLDVRTDQLYRGLAGNLQDWAFLPGADESLDARGAASAMVRLIELAGDPSEAANRFSEMLLAAVEQVNLGSLARGTAMLALAEQAAKSGAIDPTGLLIAWSSAHQKLDPEAMRRYLAKADKRALLKRLLQAFPALTPQGLLKTLKGEENKDARRLLLALLEVHGAPARAMALQQLDESTFAGDYGGWYFERNLVYLLRHIPRSPEQHLDTELACLERLTETRRRPSLIKEALANLGAIKTEGSEQILTRRLVQYEKLLTNPNERVPQKPADVLSLIDRCLASLARVGTYNAYRAIIDYGLREKPEPALGDTRLALTHLASVDLSVAPPLAERLLKELRARMPMKVLGMSLKVRNEDVRPLMEALAATTLPEVKEVLAEFARRRLGAPTGEFAAKKLADLEQPKPPDLAAGMAGELEAFDLPMILQTLEQGRSTGSLVLKDSDGAVVATLDLDAGRLRGCRTGRLAGQDAFFQLLERPVAKSFAFSPRPVSGDDLPAQPLRLTPLLAQAIARHRDLRRASIVAGDDARFRATGVRPSPMKGEDDPTLLRDVWTRASAGASPMEVECAVVADAYRVRRLFAHWLKEGALTAL